LPFHLMERPVVLLATAAGQTALVLPILEQAKLAGCDLPLTGFTYPDNPATWQSAFNQAAAALHLNNQSIGIEPNHLRVLELQFLQNAILEGQYPSAEAILAGLRMQKDANELAAMRRAVQIAQEALLATLPFIQPGRTEKAIASELVSNLLRMGSDPALPFFPIVSGGPNSANPHAVPSDRPLGTGELLVIDWGAAYDGYLSDLTRTFAIGPVEDEYRRIADLVLQANAAGRAAGKPGIPAGDIDRAARAVIDAAGYGAYFTHRTGHGLGREGHEPPYMFAENELILQPGMTYTVEPGIYLPNRGGVRIEDNVAITSTGCEVLSDLPRELVQL
jgi:Xaa-Pro dipeptidase